MHEHIVAINLAKENEGRSLNEADTRHQVINRIIHDVLGWPENHTALEKAVNSGYCDYVLKKASGQIAIVIEAKREGLYFSIPITARTGQDVGHISIRTLMTDKNVSSAILQVRNYCLDLGCSYGAITNGHEWIIFRAFEQGIDWKSLRAFVIPSLDGFSSSFTQIFNSLSYRCVSYDGSLNSLLSRSIQENRETYRPGFEIPAYARAIQPNKYVQQLRPIADRYFGVIDETHLDFMDACYVSDREYENAFRSAQSLLTDSLTPYLEEYGIKQITNDDGGGAFGNRIEKSILERRGDVVVLFGGKGIGKSTFLRKLLFVRQPQILRKNAVTIIIDLLSTPEELGQVHNQIWQKLVAGLDINKILDGNRDNLLRLFSDRFEVAQKQDLYGLIDGSVDYQKSLNNLIAEWKKDQKYVAERLVEYLRSIHKGAVVVIDNTDQYGRKLQEHCFSTAHEIAASLKCLTIVSMREERFYASSIHGVLDAYQNSGFHLSSPPPHSVFIKRLEYVKKLLSADLISRHIGGIDANDDVRKTIRSLVVSFEKEFRNPNSHLASFLTACAHGNIRLALELFRGMLISRYTNIEEITSSNTWKWQIHQVLKPVMIPNRFFYDETQSHVPNIFQLRSKIRSSHFTALRVLRPLSKLNEIQGTAFQPISSIIIDFSNRFQMDEDFRLSCDMLLKYGLIESSNRIDEFNDDIDGLRITAYGNYIYNDLIKAFTYIELVSTDTAVFDSRISAELASLSIEEYGLWEGSWVDVQKRLERVETRLKKADEFVRYLEAEEEREVDDFGLTPEERFTPGIRISLDDESENVRRSANRQIFK
ncbi:hypothetical protein MRBLMS1_004749 [Massilia sp. LMS1-1-1.1]